jgi:hypothetical protein
MSGLTGLKLVSMKKPLQISPVFQRRNKLSKQIWHQIQLAKALAEGRDYAPERTVTVKDKQTGQRHTVTRARRIRQWWFVTDTGRVCLQVRYGSRVLDLAKGKNSIEVGTSGELLNALEVVKTAIDAGELDAAIESASAFVGAALRGRAVATHR